MMVGSCRSCICCGYGGDKGSVDGGQGFDGENEKEEEDKGFVFGIGLKGEGKRIKGRILCKRERGEVALAGQGDGRGQQSGLGYFEGDNLVERCRR